MAITSDEPMNNYGSLKSEGGKPVQVYNCEMQTLISSEFKCPILNKVVTVENGICKERCEFAS